MTEEDKIIATLDGWELLRFHELGGSVSLRQRRRLGKYLAEIKSERYVPRPAPYVEPIKYTAAVGTTRDNRRSPKNDYQRRRRELVKRRAA